MISFVKKCKKKLIFVLIILLIFALFFVKSYFSEATTATILAKSKIVSAKYIESIISTEISTSDSKLFYENVTSSGLTHASFDVNKANLIVSKTMKKLGKIADDFNEDCNFDIEVPINYLLMSSSYFLSDVTLKVDCSSLLFYDVKLVSNIKEYGINSSLVSLSLAVSIDYQIIIPFIYKDVSNYIEIPLVLEVINGIVPEVLFTY